MKLVTIIINYSKMNSDLINDSIQENEDDNGIVRPDDIDFEDEAHVEPASDTDEPESEEAFRAKEEILRPSGDQV